MPYTERFDDFEILTLRFTILRNCPNMELMLLLLSPLFLTDLLYFAGDVRLVNITLFLTGCLCAFNYNEQARPWI